MWPEVRYIGSLGFTLYDVMRGVAVVVSLGLCLLLNYRQAISVRQTLIIAVIAVPVCIGAARLLNSIEYGATFSIFNGEFIGNSGSSIYGALVVCVLLIWLLTWIMQISALRFLDASAPAIAIGEALSRVGCFCAGCCYGKIWNGPWAVIFPGESFAAEDQRRRGILDINRTGSLPVHPVQLYGVILMVLLAWVLIRCFQRPHQDGRIFFVFLFSYGAYRLAIIPFRMEALTSMKVFSAVFILAGIFGLFWGRHPSPKQNP